MVDIAIQPSTFRIPTGDHSRDATEVALELCDLPETSLLTALGASCNVRLLADDAFAIEVLRELGCKRVGAKNGVAAAATLDKRNLADTLGRSTIVVIPDGVDSSQLECELKGGAFVVLTHERPTNASNFRHLIVLRFSEDGQHLIMEVDGKDEGAFETASPRMLISARRGIQMAAQREREARPAPKIIQPNLSADRLTTLAGECACLASLIEWRLFNYQPPAGRDAGAVFKLLLAQTEHRTDISGSVQQTLQNIIRGHMSAGRPIPVSLSFAIGCRIPNLLKFKESVQLPTWAWLYIGFFFLTLHRKVQAIYGPGIRLIMFDEATLFAPNIEGIDPAGVARFLKACRVVFEKMGVPIEIVPLDPADFPASEVGKIAVTVPDDQVYAMLCSLHGMNDAEIMADLYVTRARDYGAIKRRAGSQWEQARAFSEMVVRHLQHRKNAGLFGRLLGGIPVVDACITDKTDRVVLDVTSPALPNHGIPVVRRAAQGQLKVEIIPEYRVEGAYPSARPVRISPAEFGESGEPFTFYYLVE